MQRIRQLPDGRYEATYGGVVSIHLTKKKARDWCWRQCKRLRREADRQDVGFHKNLHAIRSMEEVGRIMRLSKSRVEQIEKVALRKFRMAFILDGTKEEFFG